MRRYGITTKEIEAKLTSQDYKCQCCSNSLDGLVVDHCHTTGKVRDLLCNNCNKALGLVYENVETLRSMINYLTKHKGVD